MLKAQCEMHAMLRKCIDSIMKKLTSRLNCLNFSNMLKKCNPVNFDVLHTTNPINIQRVMYFVIIMMIPPNPNAKKHAGIQITFWTLKKRYFLHQNRKCHQKSTTYLHALHLNVYFRIFHGYSICGSVNPEFEETLEKISVKVKFLEIVDTKLGQVMSMRTGHKSCHVNNRVPVEIDTQTGNKVCFFSFTLLCFFQNRNSVWCVSSRSRPPNHLSVVIKNYSISTT